MVILFFTIVIGLIFLVGILTLKESIFLGATFILIGFIMLIMSIIKFRKIYLVKANKE